MNCLFCNNSTEQIGYLLFRCSSCPIQVSFSAKLSSGETLVDSIYFWISSNNDEEYWVRVTKNKTILSWRFKELVTLDYAADLTPQTAPEFAHKLLNLKAFS